MIFGTFLMLAGYDDPAERGVVSVEPIWCVVPSYAPSSSIISGMIFVECGKFCIYNW